MTPTLRHMLSVLLLLTAPATRAQVSSIVGTAIDIDIGGKITVLDRASAHVRRYSPEGKLFAEIGGNGWSSDQFDRPSGLWTRNGIDVYVADEGNHRIQRFDRNLNFVSSFSTRDADSPDIRFGYPRGVSLSRHGELYILDGENIRVLKVNQANQVERTFGGFDAGEGKLTDPRGIQIGPRDRVYILDGERVVQYDGFGNFVGILPLGDDSVLTCLFADDNGVVVVGTSSIYWFDGNGHVVGRTAPPPAALPASSIAGIAVSGQTAYLLTPKGLVPIQPPLGWADQ
jgi:hypothetical protein